MPNLRRKFEAYVYDEGKPRNAQHDFGIAHKKYQAN